MHALARLLRALGVDPERIPVEIDEAAALYRSVLAGRRVLVVLDNAADAGQVRPLLPGSAGCVALLTSRDRLAGLVASHGAGRLALDVLGRGEAVALLARIVGPARAAAEPDAVEELARVCAGLPLALRIAAANIAGQSTTVGSWAAALGGDRRLAGLAIDGDPQVAVGTAFDHSYRRLAQPARRLFRLLGLVPGPDVSVPAAAALAGITTDRAAELLTQLTGVHLVEVRAPDRFGCHDLLRRYARSRAGRTSVEQRQAALQRLLAWYLRGVSAAATLLYPGIMRLPSSMADPPAAGPPLPPIEFSGQTMALAWLEAEWSNLVSAITYTAEHGPRRSSILIADALRGFFWMHRNPIDHRTIAAAALFAAQRETDLYGQTAAELSLGDASQFTGRYAVAIEHYTRAADLARRAGWQAVRAPIFNNMGTSYGDTGDLERAIECQNQAFELYRRHGDLRGQAAALGNLGNFWGERGDLRRAREFQVRALTLYRQIDSRVGEANCLDTLGEIAHAQGRLQQARDHLTRAAALHREIGDHYGEAHCLRCLAAVELDAGNRASALDLAHAAVVRAGDIGDPLSEAEAHNTAGRIRLRLDSPEQAEEHHRRALHLAQAVGARQAEIGALLGLSAAGSHPGARDAPGPPPAELAEQACALASAAGYRILEGQARVALATARLFGGRYTEAADLARASVTTLRETGHRLGHVDALVTLGHAVRHLDGVEAAAQCWRAALNLAGGVDGVAADVRRLLAASG